MQASGSVCEANREIFHYWNFKEFRMVLNAFFKQYQGLSTEALIDRIENINPRRLIKPKLQYEQTRGLRRVYKKIIKGKWQMPAYDL